jgi:hypothetical protein
MHARTDSHAYKRLFLDKAFPDCLKNRHPAGRPFDAKVAAIGKRGIKNVVVHGKVSK